MEDFRVIYRILKYLQQSMDFEEFDCAGFTAERFGTCLLYTSPSPRDTR